MNKFIYCLIILSVLITRASADEPWQFRYTKEGITVQSRPVKGFEFNEYIGTALINASPELCMKIMNDPASYNRWMHACIESREVEPKQGKNFTYYIQSESPWPASNRDGIYKSTFVEKDGSFTYINTALDRADLVPVKKKVVRQTVSIAHWIFVKKPGGIEVSYYIRTDPGGNISASLFNATGTDIPYKNLIAFRKRVMELNK